MKTHNKITLGLISLSIVTASAFFATTAGSLAWYAYSRSITVSYVGTSVAKSVLLNVGIVDDEEWLTPSQCKAYQLERQEYDGHSIVFTHSTNGLDYRAIQSYLIKSNYATNMLFPLTTQERALDSTDPLTLYKSPDYGDTSLTRLAQTGDYVQLPFAYKIATKDDEDIVNTDIWLTDVSVQAQGEHIDEAVRVFVEDKRAYVDEETSENKFATQRQFLMNPSDRTTNPGATKVGGLLDLDGDGTYDYDKLELNEFYYGQHTGTVHNSDEIYGESEEFVDDYDNVNGVTDETESTFYAKHSPYAKIIDNLGGETGVNPKVAEYQTFGTVKPLMDGSGNYIEGDHDEGEGGYKICSTESATGVGYATFTIYIEGWDHVVVDKAANYSFNLGLRFEVNRL